MMTLRPARSATSPDSGGVQHLLIGLAAGLTVFWQFGTFTSRGPEDFWVVTALTVVAACLLAILTHEAGHAVAAWLAGFTITRLQLFRLSLDRDGIGHPWRFRVGPNASTASVTSIPRDTVALRRRFALLVAAGPGAGFAAALASLALAQYLHPSPPAFLDQPASPWDHVSFVFPATWPSFALNVFAVLNLMFTAMTLCPCIDNGLPSDGEHLRRLRHPEYEVDLILSWLGAIMKAGTRPRDWPPYLAAYLDRPAYAEKAMAHLYAFYLAVDSGDLERAGRMLDLSVSLLETHPTARPSGVFVEAACFAAFHRGDADAGRDFLKQAPAGELEAHTFLRAEAAVLYAGGEYAAAAEKAKAGLEAVPRSEDRGGSKAERDWLLTILSASLERLAAAQ